MKKILSILALSCISTTASAATVGFGIDLRGANYDRPVVRLYNISDTAKMIGFSMTIGNLLFNFDQSDIAANVPGGSATLISGDTVNGGTRVNTIAYSFTDFDAGEVFRFRPEIDPDSTNGVTDYRTVLFNNGSAPNSYVTATFDTPGGPTTVTRTLNNRSASNTRFRYNATIEIPSVPLPATGGFLIAGLGGLALMRRKRG